MNEHSKLLVIKNEPKDDVISCKYDSQQHKYRVVFSNNPNPYYYNYNNIEWLEPDIEVDKSSYVFSNKEGIVFSHIKKVIQFRGRYDLFLRLFFENGTVKAYNANSLIVEENVIANSTVKNILDYYSRVAEYVGLKSDDGTNILKKQFDKMSFISENTVLKKYIMPSPCISHNETPNDAVIFPFGCNYSQIAAVENAITNQISVIQGPPGTGKTQTILNIIANVIIRGKTVAVVSNNNSATENVYEKLEKYGFNYLAAQLGSSDNKKSFIAEKQITYPDFSNDCLSYSDLRLNNYDITQLKQNLNEMFLLQNQIASLKSELSALQIEKRYFEEYYVETFSNLEIFKKKVKVTSKKVMQLWMDCQSIVDGKKKVTLWFVIRNFFLYGIRDKHLYVNPANEVVPALQKMYYRIKEAEIENEINELNKKLIVFNFATMSDELSKKSLIAFKATLANKYSGNKIRPSFDDDALWKKPNEFVREYPVILSTTHSARSSLKNYIYDYVIVDEASQVDLATGVLSMSCAKNMVIVGDLKQLPNVIPPDVKKLISDVSEKNSIPKTYRYEENSLLSSICSTFSGIPSTMLREHYRCHPKIIEFCNQKFYDGKLLIMTKDNDEKDVLKAYVTAEGNHARGHYNQRQIDEIKTEIIPELSANHETTDIGIIAPYNAQTSAIKKEIGSDFDISTVHKFQGREKDDIIISTVDNEITEFTDDPNMLNVAVSRAKKRLRVVISSSEKNQNTNIGDLVRYIQYNNFEVKKGEVYSIFDMLYKSYDDYRKKYLSEHKMVSEFDSENIMYATIEDVLFAEKLGKLGVIAHLPLNSLIRDPKKLSEDECKYAMNIATHLDFMVYNKIDKSPVLAIEVDGYGFHKEGTRQSERDKMKNTILDKYNIPLLRFNTTGSNEKEKLRLKLISVIS